MKQRILDFFGIRTTPSIPNPKLGEVWRLIDKDKCPWPQPIILVTIKGVKEGWVLYHVNIAFPTEALEIQHFTNIYKKVEE